MKSCLLILSFYFLAEISFSQCPDVAGFTYTDTCFGGATQFTGTAPGNPDDWTWDFGDPASGVNDSARGATPSHIFTKGNTTYQIKFSFPNSCGDTTTITQTVNNINPAPITITSLKDTVVCDTPYVMNAGNAGASYLWSTGETTQSIANSNGGKYWVRIFNNGCFADTFDVKVWGQGNKGNYNWLFGYKAGINFADDPPSIISTGRDSTIGGSAAISDPLGNLLFYTDGKNIYNKNNAIMSGSQGLLQLADTAQTTVIVPDPRASNVYYVFTSSPLSGLTYSIVDLSFNNGLGEIIRLNDSLTAPVTEQIAAVKDNTGDNFWVVTHGVNTNQFIAYKIGSNGFDTTKVISNAGSVETGFSSRTGYIKFSEDGTMAAVTMPENNRVEIFSFDNTTGQFTLKDTITNLTSPFGVEFSNDNSKLYVTTREPVFGHLYQYNLSAPNDSLIMASQRDISSSAGTSYGALQMGPDQKIYVAIENSNFLGVINNPDLDTTAADYQPNGINLGSGISSLGLTNFVANHFQTSSWGVQYGNVCTGMTTRFQATAPDTVYSWTWDFGDGTIVTANDTISHMYAAAGDYNVSVTAIYPCGDTTLAGTVTIIQTPVLTLHDTTVCRAGTIQLNAGGAANYSYQWSTGGTASFITTDTSGFYQVLATNNGCSDTASANVVFFPVTPFDFGPDQTLCSGDSVVLNTQNPGLTHNWSTGATQSSITVKNSGSYSVTVSNGPSCSLSDNINLTFITPPVISLGAPSQIFCEGQPVTLDAGSHPGFDYIWTIGATDQQIQPVTSGVYGVKVYQGNCAAGDTINLMFDPGPVISLLSQFILCSDNGDSIVLNPGPASSYQWSPGGETSSTLIVKAAGSFSVVAKSVNNCAAMANTEVLDICESMIYIPNIFSPNGDGTNDEFKISGANIISFHIEIFDQWGELIFTSDNINTSWNGIYRGRIAPEGAYIWKVTYSGETVQGVEQHTKVGDVTVIK